MHKRKPRPPHKRKRGGPQKSRHKIKPTHARYHKQTQQTTTNYNKQQQRAKFLQHLQQLTEILIG